MRGASNKAGAGLFDRRAFLRGAGVTVALPFLEGLPERSAWAANAPRPVCGLFMTAMGGVVVPEFFPDVPGPLTAASLAAAGKATSALAPHADRLLLVKGIDWPSGAFRGGDSHADALCASYTGMVPMGSSDKAMASGPSADAYLAATAHPGKGPIALYAGLINGAFIAQRLSFPAAGQLSPVSASPYALYLELMGMALPGGDLTLAGRRAAQLLLQSRRSVHDLVREELTALMQHPRLAVADRQRLNQHFDAIREAETTMTGMGPELVDRCSSVGLDVTTLEALKTYKYDSRRTDEMVRLYMSLVAMAFACNLRRAASLQWGDPYDMTIYDVPSNARGWKFGHISHRLQSDSAVGDDPLAAKAHAEIDIVRMKTLAAGLEHFKGRGLGDQSFVVWNNQFADGPFHGGLNIPHIIWGNGGGYLKQGQLVDVAGTPNSRLLNTLLSAALQDKGTAVETFGSGGGQLAALRA